MLVQRREQSYCDLVLSWSENVFAVEGKKKKKLVAAINPPSNGGQHTICLVAGLTPNAVLQTPFCSKPCQTAVAVEGVCRWRVAEGLE